MPPEYVPPHLMSLWDEAADPSVSDAGDAPELLRNITNVTERLRAQLEISLVQVVTDLFMSNPMRAEYVDCGNRTWIGADKPPYTAEGRYNPKTKAFSIHMWPRRAIHPLTGDEVQLPDLSVVEELEAFFIDLERSIVRSPFEEGDNSPELQVLSPKSSHVEYVISGRTPHVVIDLVAHYMSMHKMTCLDDAEAIYPRGTGLDDDLAPSLGVEFDMAGMEYQSLEYAAVTPHLTHLSAAASGFQVLRQAGGEEPFPFSLQHLACLATRMMGGEPQRVRPEIQEYILVPKEYH